MLKRIREINESNKKTVLSKKYLFEQVETEDDSNTNKNRDQNPNNQQQSQDNDEVTNINDVDVRVITDDEYLKNVTDPEKTQFTSLIDSFREQVSQIAELNPGLTIKDNQIRLDGVFNDENIKFTYISGTESGLYLSCEMSLFSDDTLLNLTKLNKFEQTFKDITEPLIRERDGN